MLLAKNAKEAEKMLAPELDQAGYVKFTVPDYQVCETD